MTFTSFFFLKILVGSIITLFLIIFVTALVQFYLVVKDTIFYVKKYSDEYDEKYKLKKYKEGKDVL
jgi:hypothetical protein